MKQGKNKLLIIGSLCAILLIMTVVYAAFQSVLKIKGTSNITSKWDILITNVKESNKGGSAETTVIEGRKNPSWDGLTANIEADLVSPGDFIEYEVTVENRGTLDAKLENINENLNSQNEAILINFEGYTKGEKLAKGTSQKIIVRIEYNPNFEGIPEIGKKEVNIELDYTQNDDYNKEESGEVTSPDRYLVTYDCTINGGTKCTNFNEYLKEGEPVNLTNQGTSKKNKFIGWNTDSKAKEGLIELQMGTEEITLYAIYEGDPIIQSWGETSDTDFHSSSYKQSIISAEFLDNKKVPETATESWDVSAAKDGSVMAWVIPDTTDNTKHHLYIGGNGGVIANEDSSNLFRGFSIIETIQFHNNFDTGNATNMAAMFNSSTNLAVLDLSNFDTGNVTNMAAMFTYCISLTSLDLSGFDTSKVTDMYYMFGTFSYKYPMNLEKIKFGNKFKTDNVTNMRNMFYYCAKLTKLNLCSFNTSKVTNMVVMFAGTTSLEKVYVGSNWVTTNADTTDMWSNSKISSVTKSDNCEVEAEDPATLNVSTTKTTNSITVVANATAESGIEKYEYQIDNGDWIESKDNIYTFTNLTQGKEYLLKVRVTSKIGKVTTSEVSKVTTNNLNVPTYSETGTTSKTVTITYPAGCGDTLTCSYQKNNDSIIPVTNSTEKVSFTDDGTIIGKVSDGINTVSSTYTVKLERVLAKGTVKGGSITLNKSSGLVGSSVTINKSPTSGFTYQGATIVCENGTKTTTTGTTFSVPNCKGTITVYPTWKKNDYTWFFQNGTNNVNLWTTSSYDVYKINLSYVLDFKYVRIDSGVATDSRNVFATTSKYNLTDYKYWRIKLDCYTASGEKYTTSSGVIRYWRNITNNQTAQETQNYSTKTFEKNDLDISNYNNSYYLTLHLLVNGHAFWCGWVENLLIGETYSYAKRS